MIDQNHPQPGQKYALTFTFLVHAGLLFVLFFGVQWKSHPPAVMEVELWSAMPKAATQVLPPPPPPEVKPEPAKPEVKVPPRVATKPEPVPVQKPDIALREEKKKPEPKPEPVKPEVKKPEPKPETKPEPKPLPKVPDFSKELQRETSDLKPKNNPNLQQMANVAAAEAEQRASSNKRGLADYAAKIRGKIRGNIVLPPNIQGNPEALFELSQLPSGEVLAVNLKRSSGNPALDTAIERAIRKSSPLPKPDDSALFQRELSIKYKPFEE